MHWDSDAIEEFVKMPIADVMKETGKIFAEKLARKQGRESVTIDDIEVTKKIYYDRVPEDVRNREIDKRIAEGETDLRQRMEKSARNIFTRLISKIIKLEEKN